MNVKLKAQGSLCWYTFPLLEKLSVIHGAFTRLGGLGNEGLNVSF